MNQALTITAFIGHSLATIFGFTSPNSKVVMDSSRVYLSTYSDSSGYFEFKQIAIPYNPSDLCFTTIDDYNRSSSPVCIPPPPASFTSTSIGPILLPPTLTIDSDHTTGQAIPNATVNIHLYQTESQPLLVKPAQAFNLPQLSAQTDQQGNFSLSIPDVYASDYRLFATVNYQDNSSPKSNTLFYSLAPYGTHICVPYIIIFILSFLLLIYLLYHYFHPKRYLPALVPIPAKIN